MTQAKGALTKKKAMSALRVGGTCTPENAAFIVYHEGHEERKEGKGIFMLSMYFMVILHLVVSGCSIPISPLGRMRNETSSLRRRFVRSAE